jgi:uncharacterized protein (DUF169 family)
MNKIYNQDALEKFSTLLALKMEGVVFKFKEKKKKSERIVELKKKTKCN